tara:strand:- start:430 stop:738 length:309 start_codon:yes stop_codon:yes gene_type:complete
MALITRNNNRFRKTYPGIRKTPSWENIDDLQFEASIVTFKDSSSETYTFVKSYKTEPSVVASAAGANADVNCFIQAISTTSVTIGTSAEIDASVHVQVIGVE